MSYRNPKQFVDTQSAANARRATEGINKGIQSFVAGYTKNRLENEKILKDTLQWEMEMRNKVTSAENLLGMSAPGMSMSMRTELNKSIKRAAELRQKSILTEDEKIELQNIMQVPDKIIMLAKNMGVYSSNVTDQVKNQGYFGGIDPTADTALTRAMLGLSGNSSIKGKSTFSLDLSNSSGPMLSLNFLEDGSNQATSISGFELEKRIQGNNTEILPIIRDESANMQEMMNTVFYGNSEGKGKIDPSFYENQEYKVIKDIRYTDGTLKGQIKQKLPNPEMVSQKMESIINSRINNNRVSNADKVGLFNMFQTSLYGKDAKQMEHDELISDEQLKQLAKDYGDFAVKTYGQFATMTDSVSTAPKNKNTSNNTYVGYNRDSNLSVEQVDGIVDDYVGNLQNYINQGNAKIFDDKLDEKGQKIVEARFEDGVLKYKLDLGKDQFSEEYEKDPNDLEDFREMLAITIDKDMPNNNINKRDITQASRVKTKNVFIEKQKKDAEKAKKETKERLANQAIALQKETKRKKEQLKKDQKEWDKYQNMSSRDFPRERDKRRYHEVVGYGGYGGKELKLRPTRYEDLNT